LVKALSGEAATTESRRKHLEQLRDLVELADASEMFAAYDSADDETFKFLAEEVFNSLSAFLAKRHRYIPARTPPPTSHHNNLPDSEAAG